MINEHDTMRDRLDDYVDGLLDGQDQRAVDAHLAGCDRCRRTVGELRDLQGQARALPREIAPTRDLWQGIRARIEAPARAEARAPVISLDLHRPAARPAPRRWSALAAAAVVLVVLSSTATALLLRGHGGPAVATLPAAHAVAEPRATSALVAFRPAEREYRTAVQALEVELEARRGALAPETVEIIEANLRIIDQAIAEARAALEADPGNPDLPLHLGGVYRQKVELLQSAIALQARS